MSESETRSDPHDKIGELLVLLRLAAIRLEEYADQEVAPLLRERLKEEE